MFKNVSAPLDSSPGPNSVNVHQSPELSPDALEICRSLGCENLGCIDRKRGYCRLLFMQLCGRNIVQGGCGIPVQTDGYVESQGAARALFLSQADM